MEKTQNAIIEDLLVTSYVDYAMSVITDRAIPDVRDGLKPVQRRCLYTMARGRLFHDASPVKSARIVGDVMGKLHPHGDASIYDAIVRMAQPFSLRYPLVVGQGNFGSLDGDGAAAMRYTEAHLSRYADLLVRELSHDTVPKIPSYDGTDEEPAVLPCLVPNLLLNGATGIAVGMATNIPPHNLREIMDAVILLLEHPEADDDALLGIVKGPDFPTGGVVVAGDELRTAYLTGKGVVKVRGAVTAETVGRNQVLVVREIPYGVNKTTLLARMAEVLAESRFVTGIRDESNGEDIRIVLDVRRDVDLDAVKEMLYRQTPLQSSFGINMLVIADGKPVTASLRQVLSEFLAFRREIFTGRLQREHDALLASAEQMEAVLKAVSEIDRVIAIIRGSQTRKEARTALCEALGESEARAERILDMQLAALIKTDVTSLQKKLEQTRQKMQRIAAVLGSPDATTRAMKEEFLWVRDTFGDDRRTVVYSGENPAGDGFLVVGADGRYVRVFERGKVPFEPVAMCRAGGAWAVVITTEGRMQRIPTTTPPTGEVIDSGAGRVAAIADSTGEYLYVVTRKGIVKKVTCESLGGSRGCQLITMRDDDRVVSAFSGGDADILIATHGRAIRVRGADVPVSGKGSGGVLGIAGGNVVSATPMTPAVLLVRADGSALIAPEDDFPVQGRGGKGVQIGNDVTYCGGVASFFYVDGAPLTAASVPVGRRTHVGRRVFAPGARVAA